MDHSTLMAGTIGSLMSYLSSECSTISMASLSTFQPCHCCLTMTASYSGLIPITNHLSPILPPSAPAWTRRYFQKARLSYTTCRLFTHSQR